MSSQHGHPPFFSLPALPPKSYVPQHGVLLGVCGRCECLEHSSTRRAGLPGRRVAGSFVGRPAGTSLLERNCLDPASQVLLSFA